MADELAEQDTPTSLPSRSCYQVQWGDAVLEFQDISDLGLESSPTEYRQGDGRKFSVMPGIQKSSTMTLKKGLFKPDNKFWDWFNQLKTNTVKRLPLTIRLLDEAGHPIMVWTLANARPAKITGTGLKAEGDEGTVESIDVVYEGFTAHLVDDAQPS